MTTGLAGLRLGPMSYSLLAECSALICYSIETEGFKLGFGVLFAARAEADALMAPWVEADWFSQLIIEKRHLV